MTDPEPVRGSPFKPWQWAELWVFAFVIAVQIGLYKVSVPAAAAWGLLVPALLIHMCSWMAPLLREQASQDRGEGQD